MLAPWPELAPCPIRQLPQTDGKMASSSKDDAQNGRTVAGVDNTARRQFDLEEFRAKAAKRELEESELEGLTPHEVKQLKRRSALLLPLIKGRC